jgi:hypothetical protein
VISYPSEGERTDFEAWKMKLADEAPDIKIAEESLGVQSCGGFSPGLKQGRGKFPGSSQGGAGLRRGPVPFVAKPVVESSGVGLTCHGRSPGVS